MKKERESEIKEGNKKEKRVAMKESSNLLSF